MNTVAGRPKPLESYVLIKQQEYFISFCHRLEINLSRDHRVFLVWFLAGFRHLESRADTSTPLLKVICSVVMRKWLSWALDGPAHSSCLTSGGLMKGAHLHKGKHSAVSWKDLTSSLSLSALGKKWEGRTQKAKKGKVIYTIVQSGCSISAWWTKKQR